MTEPRTEGLMSNTDRWFVAVLVFLLAFAANPAPITRAIGITALFVVALITTIVLFRQWRQPR